MSYSQPQQITYTTGAITTTAGAATLPIRGPKGKQGRVVDIIARCTTTHVLGSTPTKLDVGVSGTTNAYATYLPPALTAPAASALTDLPGASVLTTTVIPENTQVILTTTANAGGAPAGVITYDVVINWF
jgi:hypothetical protein